ncbi:hypothetical protein NDU88_013328, partial [Pleurodeles waltl]
QGLFAVFLRGNKSASSSTPWDIFRPKEKFLAPSVVAESSASSTRRQPFCTFIRGLVSSCPPGHLRDSWTWPPSFAGPQVQESVFSALQSVV